MTEQITLKCADSLHIHTTWYTISSPTH